ncbi:hypothetical protein Ccrd_018720, partial [Cynara cardunculus var. scolymus]
MADELHHGVFIAANRGSRILVYEQPVNEPVNEQPVNEPVNEQPVFFPLLDKGHYYLVVFNLKNLSIVVIDNRYRAVSDDDQLLQMYDFITDIL